MLFEREVEGKGPCAVIAFINGSGSIKFGDVKPWLAALLFCDSRFDLADLLRLDWQACDPRAHANFVASVRALVYFDQRDTQTSIDADEWQKLFGDAGRHTFLQRRCQAMYRHLAACYRKSISYQHRPARRSA